MFALLWLTLTIITHGVVCLPSWEALENNLTRNNFDLPPWTETGIKTKVYTKILLTSLRSVQITELDVTFHLIHQWEDTRLQYDASSIRFRGKYVLVDQDKYVLIWTPDSFVANALSTTAHTVIKPNTFIRVYPNGTLIQSIRLTAKVSCPVSSSGFPQGTEECGFRLKSYSYTKEEITLFWSRTDPVIRSDEFTVSGIKIKDIQSKNCTQASREENQPCLQFSVTLIRDYGIYILRIYVPSGFLVALGWLSMWIDKGQVGARTSLGVLCVLSLITQTLGIITLGNGLDGVIAIDVWLAVCMAFTILALAVFASVHNIKRRKEKKR